MVSDTSCKISHFYYEKQTRAMGSHAFLAQVVNNAHVKRLHARTG